MSIFELKCEEEYDDNLWEYRAIDRFVWWQIRNTIKNDEQLGRIIKVDENGFLRVNMKSRLLTTEQKNTIARLIANHRDGIYRIHGFRDLRKKIDDTDEYAKWFNKNVMDSFMYTVPTKDVFTSTPHEVYRKLDKSHSTEELNIQSFSGYSIWQTLYALDMIDPFFVSLLLTGKVSVLDIDSDTYIRFDYNGKTLYGLDGHSELCEKDENGNMKMVDDTTHTLLFKHYQEPIYTVLNSIMLPIAGDRVLPCEGLGDPLKDDLVEKTESLIKSDTYKALTKKYNLGKSRVNPKLW